MGGFTGTDEFTLKTAPTTTNGQYVLHTNYADGQGSYESYGYFRYGFNGKENDNEVKGAGNKLDFGARIYDSRLGRRLSKDKVQITGWSDYVFCTNNPIRYLDLDGNIQRDANGNIIFTPASYSSSLKSPYHTEIRRTVVKNEENAYVNCLVIEGYIYTDQGSRIKAYKVLGKYERTSTIDRNENGQYFQNTYDEFIEIRKSPGVKANCYGDCTTGGQFYLPNELGITRILSDEYTYKQGTVSFQSKFVNGDVLKIGDDHNIKAIGEDTEGNMLWSSDFATDEREVGILRTIISNLQNSIYGTYEGQDFSLKNAKLFRKKGDDRVQKNGKPTVNPRAPDEEISKTPKNDFGVIEENRNNED